MDLSVASILVELALEVWDRGADAMEAGEELPAWGAGRGRSWQQGVQRQLTKTEAEVETIVGGW